MSEREILEADVLIVGGGPAGLATALRLAELIERHNAEIDSGKRQGKKLSTEEIYLLEKGREVGAHLLSGAVMDPRGLRELVPDFDLSASPDAAPLAAKVERDAVYFLTERGQWQLPITPPFLHNHGNYVVSLNRLGRWLGRKVEAKGVSVFAGFAGTELLFEGGEGGEASRVAGVRTDDKGRDRSGGRKTNFEPGYDLRAKVTVLAEGPRGSLTKQLLARRNLDQGRNPQVYAVGVKELWEVPADRIAPGTVIHSAGWPLASDQFGGGWLYSMPGAMPEGMISARSLPAVQNASPLPQNPRRRQAAQIRRQDDSRRRLVLAAAARNRRRAAGRRLRRLFELPAPEGHSPGHEERHARRRNRLRGLVRGRFFRAPACELHATDRSELDQGRAMEGPQLPSGV
jgi:2-polyprenyl-6-methoxyphenol hydroxylase-like FAD-dependent oxidoreductase